MLALKNDFVVSVLECRIKTACPQILIVQSLKHGDNCVLSLILNHLPRHWRLEKRGIKIHEQRYDGSIAGIVM